MAIATPALRDPTAVLGRRIAAYLIDVGLVAVVGVALVVTGYTRYFGAPGGTCPGVIASAGGYLCHQIGGHLYVMSPGAVLRVEALTMLTAFLDLVVLQAFTGASVGKRCLGLRVVDDQGQPASFLNTLGRWVFLTFDSLIFVVGLVTVFKTHPHRRLGDFAFGTYVVAAADVGRPIAVARYQVPRSGASTAADRRPPNGSPKGAPKGSVWFPKRAAARAARAAMLSDPLPAAPRNGRNGSASRSTLARDAAAHWAKPPAASPERPDMEPAMSSGSAQSARRGKPQRPRWSAVASLPQQPGHATDVDPEPPRHP